MLSFGGKIGDSVVTVGRRSKASVSRNNYSGLRVVVGWANSILSCRSWGIGFGFKIHSTLQKNQDIHKPSELGGKCTKIIRNTRLWREASYVIRN
ncbi:hypothetical protein [uncultured Nostoc sp.]|uniref:hypothetical protein n=1 Tax=uncultured Nostoc sp. TaxID=340711 RepID=UPI0035CAD3B6|nr:hypothetical protein [Nostoc sp. NMS8]